MTVPAYVINRTPAWRLAAVAELRALVDKQRTGCRITYEDRVLLLALLDNFLVICASRPIEPAPEALPE